MNAINPEIAPNHAANLDERAEAAALFAELAQFEREVAEFVAGFDPAQAADNDSHFPTRRVSVRNLLAYLAVRRRDLRGLQTRLERLGLSSLGRAESHVQASLRAVLRALAALAGSPLPSEPAPPPSQFHDVRFTESQQILDQQTERLLGPAPPGRVARIMVTAPREAAFDPALLRNLLANGMNCLRINCAHDEPAVWLRMIEHLRAAEAQLGRSCRICMDLAGPKLRTGPLPKLPGVLRVRPRRDALGCVIAPARVRLAPAQQAEHSSPSEAQADAVLPLAGDFRPADLRPGDRLRVRDARGARRVLRVISADAAEAWAELDRTCYFVEGQQLTRIGASPYAPPFTASVGKLPSRSAEINLQAGDRLVLTRETLLRGSSSTAPEAEAPASPAGFPPEFAGLPLIGCTLPEFFSCVRPDEAIAFDDGKIGGVIRAVTPEWCLVEITQAPTGGARLRADKGINLPESQLAISPLTEKDLTDLKFVVAHADLVALSFASRAADIRLLVEELAKLASPSPAIVIKVETRRGFRNLPSMLLAALRGPGCGVMIARGDLAVECGFERLAEVQEEILWICEAAHVPVIWATQVLESLAKAGLPSRAEITDAAASNRAECVMLNKGPHIVRAVQTLSDILRRMQAHGSKKRSMLRPLRLACEFTPE